MLAFVSPVNARSVSEPIRYGDIQGREYAAIQTNESAIVFVERKLEAAGESLSKIFLIASDFVKSKPAPTGNEFGDVTHLEFLKRRVAKEFPQLADRFSTEDYSEEGEDSTKLERNILQILLWRFFLHLYHRFWFRLRFGRGLGRLLHWRRNGIRADDDFLVVLFLRNLL